MNAKVSFAQQQEDILLDRFFSHQVGSYLDIGGHHPVLENNTYFFYNRGWTGTVIEPQLQFQALYRQFRPRDRLIGAAIGELTGLAPFYRVHDLQNAFGLCTLDAEVAATHRANGFTVTQEECHSVSLRDLAQMQPASPDFVSIDVEGFEAAVLRTFPFDVWKPAIFVVEAVKPLSYESSHQQWEPYLLSNEYDFVHFNGVNRFYLHRSHTARRRLLEHPVCKLDSYITFETMLLQNRIAELEQRLQ